MIDRLIAKSVLRMRWLLGWAQEIFVGERACSEIVGVDHSRGLPQNIFNYASRSRDVGL